MSDSTFLDAVPETDQINALLNELSAAAPPPPSSSSSLLSSSSHLLRSGSLRLAPTAAAAAASRSPGAGEASGEPPMTTAPGLMKVSAFMAGVNWPNRPQAPRRVTVTVGAGAGHPDDWDSPLGSMFGGAPTSTGTSASTDEADDGGPPVVGSLPLRLFLSQINWRNEKTDRPDAGAGRGLQEFSTQYSVNNFLTDFAW